MDSADVARLMVRLLQISPAGSYAWYDDTADELVLVASDGAWNERRFGVERATPRQPQRLTLEGGHAS